jgi:hypothetical protein
VFIDSSWRRCAIDALVEDLLALCRLWWID